MDIQQALNWILFLDFQINVIALQQFLYQFIFWGFKINFDQQILFDRNFQV